MCFRCRRASATGFYVDLFPDPSKNSVPKSPRIDYHKIFGRRQRTTNRFRFFDARPDTTVARNVFTRIRLRQKRRPSARNRTLVVIRSPTLLRLLLGRASSIRTPTSVVRFGTLRFVSKPIFLRFVAGPFHLQSFIDSSSSI